MAMRDIGADFEIWKAVEIDKYAMKSYNAIHGTNFEPTDICKIHGKDLEIVDRDKYSYIMFYSWPCTSLSVAGKMEGMKEGSGTSSSLLWEVKRLIEELGDNKPDILISENVPQCHSDQNRPEFDRWLSFLKSKGYYNYWKDLNAKDYGIPQNRERCFCLSILTKEYLEYEFPEPIPLTKVMKDFLEPAVDEKYYITSQKADELIKKLIQNRTLDSITQSMEQNNERRGTVLFNNKKIEKTTDIAVCLLARDYKGLANLQLKNGVLECRE